MSGPLPTPGLPWRVGVGVLSVVLGVAIAVVGASRVETGPRVGHAVASVGCVVTFLAIPSAVRWCTVAMATRIGGVLVLVAWLGTVLRLGSATSTGSVGLNGDTPGLVLLLGGCVVGGLTAGVVRTDPPPGWFARRRAARAAPVTAAPGTAAPGTAAPGAAAPVTAATVTAAPVTDAPGRAPGGQEPTPRVGA